MSKNTHTFDEYIIFFSPKRITGFIVNIHFFIMKMQKNIFWILCLASLVQATIFTASLSQDSISVGDRILYEATIIVPKGATITPPDVGTAFGKFVVKEWNSDKVEKKNADSLNFKYVISFYEIEQCTIPPIPFIQTLNGKTDTLLSKPMPVRLVLIPNTDSAATAPSIKDLKPQQSAGKPSFIWLWIVLGLAALIALVYFSRRFWKKRKEKAAQPVPLKPPYEEAIESLRLLDEQQYLARGMIREHVFGLSDILKRYIERRFEVNAAEFTTEEMLEWIMTSPLEADGKNIAEWFFSATDPVKFAKMLPQNDTLYRFGQDVRQFLEMTRPKPETSQSQKGPSHAA
jgi:hypothetical protein